MQAEDKGNLFTLLRRCLFYAKIMQAEDKGNLFTLLRRCLFYAKIVQAEDKGNLFTLLRRCLFYAKVIYFFTIEQELPDKKNAVPHTITHQYLIVLRTR